LTFCDVIVFVAQAQRTFLDIYVFMDFVEIVQPQIAYPTSISQSPHAVHTNWMGAFTTNTKICEELFRTGVPVW
ncbi:hypothetical protein BS17DRAFT_671660, partial [Gyrodon lividus]